MPTPDLNQSFESSKSRINSIKTYIETSQAAKDLKKTAGNSESKSTFNLATSLDSISEQQKRYQRNPPNSLNQLLDLISLTRGSGLSTTDYLRKKLIEASVKAEPEIKKIISQEAIKALGCSQQQAFKGFKPEDLSITPLSTLPQSQGIYIPLQSLDFGGILKIPSDGILGRIIYEYTGNTINVSNGVYKPYEGFDPFPMLKEMNLRMGSTSSGQSYKEQYQRFYQGTSNQGLFDYQFTRTNGFGVTQDCFRVALLDKISANLNNITLSAGTENANKIGEFISDYYSTIDLYDPVLFAGVLVNLLVGALDMEAKFGYDDLAEATKFEIILQRILGLCFDNRREIDVSGVSKIAELDGVDESFFELTEVDLRNIELRVSNIQNGVVEFIDCNNIQLPVDYQTINSELVKFRDTVTKQTVEGKVQSIEAILNTITDNPEWKNLIPNSVDIKTAFNKDVLNKIPIALASSVLTPKVLFPIFTMWQVVKNEGIGLYNQAVTSANTFVQSANTITGKVNNIVNNQIDFLKVFKEFNIQVVSQIGAIYLKVLYEILKKDIINLITIVIEDVAKSQAAKYYTTILRLVNILLTVSQLVDDYRRCKSLVDDILRLLNQIFKVAGFTIPLPLLALAGFLPGMSAERVSINTIELLQSIGVPTGPLPDGSPNIMNMFNLMGNKGFMQEQAQSGKVQISTIVPPILGGLVGGFGVSS